MELYETIFVRLNNAVAIFSISSFFATNDVIFILAAQLFLLKTSLGLKRYLKHADQNKVAQSETNVLIYLLFRFY